MSLKLTTESQRTVRPSCDVCGNEAPRVARVTVENASCPSGGGTFHPMMQATCRHPSSHAVTIDVCADCADKIEEAAQ